MVLGNWMATCKRMNLGHFLTPDTKNKLKMDERPKCRTESHQNLEEKTGNNFFDLSNFLLDTSPKARELKSKMNYWDLMKIKSFCTMKETINKTKRQPM